MPCARRGRRLELLCSGAAGASASGAASSGPAGCFVSGLYLEGADWDTDRGCLIKSKPKVLVVNLPILKVIPIESHRLKLQVEGSPRSPVPSLPHSPPHPCRHTLGGGSP